MDPVSAGDTTSDVVRARRKRMRADARGLRSAPESDGFQTPQWLDRSFVLPLTVPEATDVPAQSVPHHDDFQNQPDADPVPEAVEADSSFVRPPTPEIDFARVIRRSDLSRTATRAALAATGAAGLLMVVYLLTTSALVLGMAISFGLVSLVAVGMRIRLATAPVPHLDR